MSLKLPPPTAAERAQAGVAAAAIRAAVADPSTAGQSSMAHLDMARPRRGVWITTWSALPGLTLTQDSRSPPTYSHALLPGWEYTVREMKTEMIEDLERLAEFGERPAATSSGNSRPDLIRSP